MTCDVSSRFTKFVTELSIICGLLVTAPPAAADAFDSILKQAAIDSGFARAQSTHVPVDPALAAVGKTLFESKNLSLNSDISCQDCHLKEFSSADGIPNAIGIGGKGTGVERMMGDGAIIPRNTLPLWGRGGAGFEVFFWDGKVDFSTDNHISQFGDQAPSDDPLVTTVHLPIVEIREMLTEDSFITQRKRETVESAAEVYEALVQRLKEDEPEAIEALARHFAVEVGTISFAHAASAIAGFIRHEFSLRPTAFERFVFDREPLPRQAQKGGLLFYGKGKCVTCHSGPYFSDLDFHAIATPQLGFGKNGFGVDYGRFNVTHDVSDLYLFRTPPLNNVAKTAPYGHSGSLATLRDVIVAHFDPLRTPDIGAMNPLERHEFYKRLVASSNNMLSIGFLDDDEVGDVIAFLSTLSF